MIEFRAVQGGERMNDSPMISSVLRLCRKCGAEIFADAPEGLCTACLFETGLDLLAHPSVAPGDDCAPVENVESSDANAALRVKKAPRPAKTLANFSDYELLEEIGRGGQGVVYRAHQKSLNRTVALKLIGLGPWATATHLKRCRREAEAAASLDHRSIVPIHEVGEREGSCYFSMKFIEGGQLDEVVRRAPMPIRGAVELIAKVARTVHYAHEHGILHRDIKPGNILLDKNGEPHLTDFGLARLLDTQSSVTRTIEVLGTPSYMAPEQAAGEHAKISKATDVYGLGAVLYQLLTGHPPFAGGTSYQTIRLLLDTEPRQPRFWDRKIARDLSTICLKCLEKDPQGRYSSALALAEDLEHWLRHEPIRAHRTGIFTRGRKWVRRNPTSAVLAASLIALAAAAGWIIWKSELIRHPVTNGIAVLPFENLSADPENAFFTDGVQDEILNDLAKIADLKVISRTSVMQYKSGAKRNLRQIANELGVAHVVEGSVQRAANRVRVSAQLIDAKTDTHLWVNSYDRPLGDVFAIQSEIAKAIAAQLEAKLSPTEKAAIEQPPTTNLIAYDRYLRAEKLFLLTPDEVSSETNRQAIRLLDQAIAHDPTFLLAYCLLSRIHAYLYFTGFDHTPARVTLAQEARDAALLLGPDRGEPHLAAAYVAYWCYRDYETALTEVDIARRKLPNDTAVFEIAALIARRQGDWEQCKRNLERAVELDPRSVSLLQGAADTYQELRRYLEAAAAWDRALAITPSAVTLRVRRAQVDLESRADTQPMQEVIQSIMTADPGAADAIAERWLYLALCRRDDKEMASALASLPLEVLASWNIAVPRSYYEGLAARARNDATGAETAFTAARVEMGKTVRE